MMTPGPSSAPVPETGSQSTRIRPSVSALATARRDAVSTGVVHRASRVSRAALPRCSQPARGFFLLVQQKLFDGVRQWQRWNQMEPVFAKSSSHGHTAQTQQGPRDTWSAREEGRRRKEVSPSPNSGVKAAVAEGTPAHTLPASSRSGARRAAEGLVIHSVHLRKERNLRDLRHLLSGTTPLDCLHP